MTQQSVKARNVFQEKNFRLVFFGALVSDLGAQLYNFVVSFYILEISGNNAFLQGLYLALCGIALLVFTPVGGVLGDRFNRAKIMYLCDYSKGGMILLATALMLLFRQPSAHIVILFVLGMLGNVIGGIFSPASSALLPIIVERDLLQQANSWNAIRDSLQGILGIVLAGVLYAALPIHTLFFLVGAAYLLSGVSEMLIRYQYTPAAERLTIRLAVRDMRAGLRYLSTQKALLALLGSLVFINFFFAPIGSNFIPYFVRTDLAEAPSYLLDHTLTPELWSSIFNVCAGLGMLIGAMILSSRRQAEKCGHATAVRIGFLAAIILLLTVSYWQFVARGVSLNVFLLLFSGGCLVSGVLLAHINIPFRTAMMTMIDKDKLSKVSSFMSIASQGMIPIASVLAGAVLQTSGSTMLLFICSLGFAATAAMMLTNKAIREI